MIRRAGVVIFLMSMMVLAGCREHTAVVSTTNLPLGGTEGKTVLVSTNKPGKTDPVVIDTPGRTIDMVVSADDKTVYMAQRKGGHDVISVVDADAKRATEVAIEGHILQIRHIWDMALSRDGSKLLVGTRNSAFTSCWIEIYDSISMERLISFKVKRHLLDYYRIGQKIVVNPVKDEIYVMLEGDKVQDVRIRTMGFDGSFKGDDIVMNADHWDYNYGFEVSENGKLLIGVSDKVYPYEITDEGLTALPAIAGDGDKDLNYYGKVKVLFTEDFGVAYITSSGLYLPGTTNLGGTCTVLNVKKILAGDPDPFIHSTVNFIYDDFIKWITKNLNEDIGSILDITQLYGIADSCMVGNTCYMVIASVVGLGTDMTEITDGKYILSAFQTMPLGGQVWLGGKVLSKYPGSLSVNSDNDTLVVTYPWNKSLDILKKKGSWLTPSTTSIDMNKIHGLGSATYTKSVSFTSVERD